jgi:hypothetical protein
VLIERPAAGADAIAVPDTHVSQIATIEEMPGGLMRFSFFGPDGVTLAPINLVMHADNVLAGAKQTLLKVVGLTDIIAKGLPDHFH